ncbi:serine/threonine-protein kinase TNNI3K isoform X1 [Boleophthalmus pectinirostris]|uniref:serine/threonine-protein kinase TNNI3K isoform X1 n=1 Tax=Boleophthalmus pectinirostris TaxID=150288 RepID=UPI00242D34BE|nr:serine/threonine-protein kinase TNNI3K isoform X1 [Boleophthalmus pectinirostris]
MHGSMPHLFLSSKFLLLFGETTMGEEYNKQLKIATHQKLLKFDDLRGREVKPGEFWDVVVVTAVDESQKDAYELQINEKIKRKELPLGIDYKVVSDPPGYKIGNGGSTLYTLQHLSNIYGTVLNKLRVLLIHAGGLSQRLPSASALGKIFTALPLGNPLYQMLELKMAMYVDFPSHMKPGVLVTCADDIELYSIAEDQCISFDKPGFTALGHPSSLSIGTTHGVFVLDPSETSSHTEMQATSCLRFLHKPSVNKMRDTGAVCNSTLGREFVYTDSTYYFDLKTSQLLLNLLKEVGPLECEIDAYGDFLQALGPEASIDYTSNTANVTKEEGNLVEIRKKIFHLLRGTPLNVILLNNSKFYHIGTTSEFLYHLTQDAAMRNELGLLSSAFSLYNSENNEDSTSCCVMYSVVDTSCSVGIGSVVEYCQLEAGVYIGKGSIISSCWVHPGLSVPDSVFMHSLCIDHKHSTGYVTVVFGINDNLKSSVDHCANISALKLFGLSLPYCLFHWGMESERLNFSGDVSCCSLWNACLFPLCSDQKTSFSKSLEMLQAVLNDTTITLPKDTQLLSMQQALETKNLKEMLKFRTGLFNVITQKLSAQ